ncbi:MAG TPA: hypothetical protein VFW19_09105 [Allosphingosinicella sp.]|nr:hypothetical protein [Allosphingosinicella sp.]
MSAETAPGAPQPPRTHWIIWLFAIVGFLVALAFIVLFVKALGFDGRGDPSRVAGKKKEDVFVVNTPVALAGTDLLAMNVNLSEGGLSSGPSYGRGDERNILLIDKATGASRRLLADNNRTIEEAHFLPASASPPTDDPGAPSDPPSASDKTQRAAPVAYYAIVLKQAEQNDVKDVLVGTINGDRQGVVMRGIDGVETLWMQSPTQLAMIVRDHFKLSYRLIDIPSLKMVQSRPVPID